MSASHTLGSLNRSQSFEAELWEQTQECLVPGGTHRLLTLSTKTLVAGRAGDLQLVSIIDKPRDALRRRTSFNL